MARLAAPPGLGRDALKLWRDVVGKYELDVHEIALLRQVVATLDDITDFAAIVAAQGLILNGRVNPAQLELRQLRLLFGRLLSGLRVPSDMEGESEGRPQRRGARGFYVVGEGA